MVFEVVPEIEVSRETICMKNERYDDKRSSIASLGSSCSGVALLSS